MNFEIIAVGNLKENYLQDAAKEYLKRLTRYGKVNVVEIKESTVFKEGVQICARLKNKSHVVALCIEGKTVSSEEFAADMEKLANQGKSHLTFIIGGSEGLDKSVLDRAEETLSFSSMTFPHQLMRIILLEQIYRACTISNGEKYHK